MLFIIKKNILNFEHNLKLGNLNDETLISLNKKRNS